MLLPQGGGIRSKVKGDVFTLNSRGRRDVLCVQVVDQLTGMVQRSRSNHLGEYTQSEIEMA